MSRAAFVNSQTLHKLEELQREAFSPLFPPSPTGPFCVLCTHSFTQIWKGMGREPANSASSSPQPCLCGLINYSLSRYKLCSLAQTCIRAYAAACVWAPCRHRLLPPCRIAPPCCWVIHIKAAGLTPPDNRWLARCGARRGADDFCFTVWTERWPHSCAPLCLITLPVPFFMGVTYV